MSLAVLFHFLCAQRVSDINISIILMTDILMSETCWAHKWNKIASDIKLVFHSSYLGYFKGIWKMTRLRKTTSSDCITTR